MLVSLILIVDFFYNPPIDYEMKVREISNIEIGISTKTVTSIPKSGLNGNRN
ncbi:MAG: hypothetical protein BalsKO_10680 [Balneolaceae bacterium]